MNFILYPILTYGFIKFCKQYYKYILHYNLLVIDMYDKDNEYQSMEITKKSDKSTSTIDDNDLLIALNQIPT